MYSDIIFLNNPPIKDNHIRSNFCIVLNVIQRTKRVGFYLFL